jgi:hypothetical protein
MPKEFYTERDIDELVKRGVMSLELSDNVVLTELAYERANKLGLKLVTAHENPPSAPVRPYMIQASQSSGAAATDLSKGDLHQRIRSAVIARLGNQVDPTLLDTIISRVLNSTGVK